MREYRICVVSVTVLHTIACTNSYKMISGMSFVTDMIIEVATWPSIVADWASSVQERCALGRVLCLCVGCWDIQAGAAGVNGRWDGEFHGSGGW
jgi:hypothetical protein